VNKMQFEVLVELKGEVLDTEGRAIGESLRRLGFGELKDVKVTKRFLLNIDGDQQRADQVAQQIAREYLANPVSETFKVKKL